MTTDLRKILHTAAVRLDSYSAIGFTSEGAATRALADQLRTIADAPPTVAELLPLVDATHEVHWNDGRRRAALVVDLVGVEMRVVGRWEMSNLYAADLTRPATLVEVTP